MQGARGATGERACSAAFAHAHSPCATGALDSAQVAAIESEIATANATLEASLLALHSLVKGQQTTITKQVSPRCVPCRIPSFRGTFLTALF